MLPVKMSCSWTNSSIPAEKSRSPHQRSASTDDTAGNTYIMCSKHWDTTYHTNTGWAKKRTYSKCW